MGMSFMDKGIKGGSMLVTNSPKMMHTLRAVLKNGQDTRLGLPLAQMGQG